MIGLFYTFIARIPKLKLEIVSSICIDDGPIVTINEVLQLPPKLSYNNLVNLESLNGTYDYLTSVSEWMHLPNAERDELIDLASVKRSPVDLDFFTLSDPARSTMYKVDYY
jgi:hypothetical protein